MKRWYSSIYFPYIDKTGQKQKKNLCIAFNNKENELYKYVELVGSKKIKKLLGIHSYEQLLKTAEKEGRKPTAYIKYALKLKLMILDDEDYPTDEEILKLFHKLWTNSARSLPYEKRKWGTLQMMLIQRGIKV